MNQKIYYHGTNKDFKQFSIPNNSRNIKSPLGLLGIYFTSDPQLASNFTKVCWNNPVSKYKKGANVIPVKLKLTNPIELPAKKFIQLGGLSDSFLINFRKNLIEKGYDSIVFKKPLESDFYYDVLIDEFSTDQIVVFDNKNIQFLYDFN